MDFILLRLTNQKVQKMNNFLIAFVIQVSISMLACIPILNCQIIGNITSETENLTINQEIASEEGGLILVGQINRDAWQNKNYREWFSTEYQSYKVDESAITKIKTSMDSLEIMIFFGTWCSDSRQEVPRFYKILDFLEFKENRLKVVALDDHPDRYKQSPQHEEVGWDIEYVPTFIFLLEGKEIGRFVESPDVSLEKDLVKIVAKSKN